MRTLQDGTKVEELKEAKILKVKTKCPEKWLLIDLETGEKYRGHITDGKNDWSKINDN